MTAEAVALEEDKRIRRRRRDGRFVSRISREVLKEMKISVRGKAYVRVKPNSRMSYKSRAEMSNKMGGVTIRYIDEDKLERAGAAAMKKGAEIDRAKSRK